MKRTWDLSTVSSRVCLTITAGRTIHHCSSLHTCPSIVSWRKKHRRLMRSSWFRLRPRNGSNTSPLVLGTEPTVWHGLNFRQPSWRAGHFLHFGGNDTTSQPYSAGPERAPRWMKGLELRLRDGSGLSGGVIGGREREGVGWTRRTGRMEGLGGRNRAGLGWARARLGHARTKPKEGKTIQEDTRSSNSVLRSGNKQYGNRIA